MQYLILFIVIVTISIVIAIKLKISTEQAIPITVVGIIILVYLAGILGNLLIGIYLIIATVLLSFIYLTYYLIKHRKDKMNIIKSYLTPGILIYGFIYIIFVLLNKNRIFENYDEFNHWGLIIKEMYINNDFAFNQESVTVFNEYPPFTAVFEYILLKFSSSYSEDTIIIANNILVVSMMMPIFKKVNWDKSIKWIFVITPLILFIPLIVYENFYFNILVDALLGVLIAFVLYQWFINDENKMYRNFATALGIIAIILTKTSGIGISILIVVVLIGDCILRRTKKDIFTILIIFFVAILLLGIWNFNINRNNNRNWDLEKINIENIINLIKEGEPEGKKSFANEYLQAIFTRSTLTERNLTVLSSTLILIIINIYVYNQINKKYRPKYKYYSICMYIFEAIYLVYLLFVYLFLFDTEETIAFSSFERYFGTIFLGILMFHILIGLDQKEKINTKNIIVIWCIIVVFLPVKNIREKIINGESYKMVSLNDRKTYIKILDYKLDLSEDDKIYYIDTTYMKSRYSLQIMKYQMLPIRINNEGEFSDILKLKEIWKEKNYTHLYIQKLNDILKQNFEQEFSIEMENESMYRILCEDNITKLEKVE